MPGAKWVGDWPGGRVRRGRNGPVYVIERMVSGVRRSISLPVASESAALAELALFERDPANYRRQGEDPDAAPVVVDVDTVIAFLEHQRLAGRVLRYRQDARHYLADWSEDLAGRDLRTVSTRELRGVLAQRATARKARIIHLKSFCSWLRDREDGPSLTTGNDPSLGLTVPPPRPAKALAPKGYTVELIERLYGAVWRQDVRDVLRLRACTGMHHSEIERIAAGEGVLRRLDDRSGITGTVRFVHKSGKVHVLSLDLACFSAARRLQGFGRAPRDHIIAQVFERAARRLDPENPPKINPGELRHSFATWAPAVGIEVRPTKGGVPQALVSAVLGHESERTSRRFYVGTSVPPMIRIPIRLDHPDDPVNTSKGDK